MTTQIDDVFNKDSDPAQSPGDAARKCWNSILLYPQKECPLDRIYAEAEELVQYCVATAEHRDIVWLKNQVQTSERAAVAQLAADPGDPERQRAHAALAGALAGLLYPLGRSPRDLNQMSF